MRNRLGSLKTRLRVLISRSVFRWRVCQIHVIMRGLVWSVMRLGFAFVHQGEFFVGTIRAKPLNGS